MTGLTRANRRDCTVLSSSCCPPLPRTICRAPENRPPRLNFFKSLHFRSASTFRLRRCICVGATLALHQNGVRKVRKSWQERFADTPAVLMGGQRPRTIIPVLDLSIGDGEFVTIAGPCAVENEFQLMATAHHVRRAGARVLRGGAFKPRSPPYSFQGLGLKALQLMARARRETGLAI